MKDLRPAQDYGERSAREMTDREFYARMGPPETWGQRHWAAHRARQAAQERRGSAARGAAAREARLLRSAAGAFREAGERRRGHEQLALRAGLAWRERTADALNERHVRILRGERPSGQLRRRNAEYLRRTS